jgi:uncharacterized membrane protein YedE/YeeE
MIIPLMTSPKARPMSLDPVSAVQGLALAPAASTGRSRLGAWPVVLVALGLFLALEGAIAAETGGQVASALTAAIGLAIGATLLLAEFGFAVAFRRAAEAGDFGIFRAHFLMFGLGLVLMVPAIAAGQVLGRPVGGFATPIGPSFVLGALLFGLGMQMAGGCASGTLYLVGGGNAKFLGTLVGFVLGSVLGAATIGFWWSLPAMPPITLFSLGPWPATLALELAGLVILDRLVARRAGGPLPRRLVAGAVALALLNAATLVIVGHPWSETWGFTLWGSKLAQHLGAHPESWVYWSDGRSLYAGVFADTTSIMDLSIILGALLAAGVTRRFAWRLGGSPRAWAAAALGGILMGYGARLSGGCNIGAYFSSIVSGDLSGWVWLLVALPASVLGLRLRRLVEGNAAAQRCQMRR